MAMTKAQTDKIKVKEDLETWPALLTSCEELLKAYRLTRKQIFGTDAIEEGAKRAIALAKQGTKLPIK